MFGVLLQYESVALGCMVILVEKEINVRMAHHINNNILIAVGWRLVFYVILHLTFLSPAPRLTGFVRFRMLITD